MQPLESNNLRIFVCVAKHLSFSLAAEELHLTQPAVSKRIAALEEQLGKTLFERFRRKVFLTEAGAILLPQAKQILNKIEETSNGIKNLGATVEGTLSIAFSHHAGLHRLPPYLKDYRQKFPHVRLDVQFVDSDAGYQKVQEADTELAVITLKPDTTKNFETTMLWKDPLVFVCSSEHELHLRDNVTLEELGSLEAILPSSETETRKIINSLFEGQNLAMRVSMDTNYLETIKMMVSIGLGWSVLPKTMTKGLEVIHVPDTYLERNLGMIHHSGRKLSRAANAFAELLNNAKKPT